VWLDYQTLDGEVLVALEPAPRWNILGRDDLCLVDLELAALASPVRARALLFPPFVVFVRVLLELGRLDLGPGFVALQSGNLVFQGLDLFLLQLNDLQQGDHEGRTFLLGDVRNLWDGRHAEYQSIVGFLCPVFSGVFPGGLRSGLGFPGQHRQSPPTQHMAAAAFPP
jgi:hypothetical protein